MSVTKKRVLLETKVIIEPGDLPFGWQHKTQEERKDWLENWAKEMTAFFRDHRSMDVNAVYAEPTYQIQCSDCHHEWEEAVDENYEPCCAWCGLPMEIT